MKIIIKEGNYEKLGVVYRQDWTVFTFHAEKEDKCAVVLVRKQDNETERIEIPEEFCLGSLRSIAVKELAVEDYVYYFEINGKKVLDPYAQGIMGRQIWNDPARRERNYEVYDAFVPENFDWGNSQSPEISRAQMVMYKLHVRGFTMDSGRKTAAGTFRALMDRISYLKKLGITTLELMPVYEFEEMEVPVKKEIPEYVNWEEKQGDVIRQKKESEEVPTKVNYWGYTRGDYFAVKASYAADSQHASTEYKTFVKKLHDNQMECVMEMYFPDDMNQNVILDVLRYWVREYRIDGFHLLGNNLPMTAIIQDSMLSRTKIFYSSLNEKVCRAGRKQKNMFVYTEEYLYPARRLLNHMNGSLKDFMNQQRKQGEYLGYVNFISSNNGFTLADLFMYNDKHNEDNGENNRDGSDCNLSNNYGVEGPTRKKYINSIRRLKWRNSVLMLLFAQGVPLFWAGDEMGNSQKGNNNAYCQDNEIGWLNWKNEKTHQKELEFLRKVIAFRKEHPIIASETPFQFSDYKSVGCPDLSYHGENAWVMEPAQNRMCMGIMYCGAYGTDESNHEDVYVAYNFLSAMTTLALPKLTKGKRWDKVIDSGDGQMPFLEESQPCGQGKITIRPQTICVFVSKEVPMESKGRKRRG